MLQAIAVLMMMFHHFFMNPDSLTLLQYANVDLYTRISWMCRLCVALFAFISGYGMHISEDLTESPRTGDLYRKAFLRILRLYLIVWFSVLLFPYLSKIILKAPTDLSELCGNAFGYFYTYDGSWWYISFYFLLCLTYPVIRILVTKSVSRKRKCILLAAIAAAVAILYGIAFLLGGLNFPYLMIALFFIKGAVHPAFYLCFLAGIFCAHIHFYDRILTLLHSWQGEKLSRRVITVILSSALILILCILRIILTVTPDYCKTDFLMVPFLVLGFSALDHAITGESPRQNPIQKLFLFIGNYSTGMWLIHVTILSLTYFPLAPIIPSAFCFYLAEIILALIGSVIVTLPGLLIMKCFQRKKASA